MPPCVKGSVCPLRRRALYPSGVRVTWLQRLHGRRSTWPGSRPRSRPRRRLASPAATSTTSPGWPGSRARPSRTCSTTGRATPRRPAPASWAPSRPSTTSPTGPPAASAPSGPCSSATTCRASSWPPTTPSSSGSSRPWSGRPPTAATTCSSSPTRTTSWRCSASWWPSAGSTGSSCPGRGATTPGPATSTRPASRSPCSAAPPPACPRPGSTPTAWPRPARPSTTWSTRGPRELRLRRLRRQALGRGAPGGVPQGPGRPRDPGCRALHHPRPHPGAVHGDVLRLLGRKRRPTAIVTGSDVLAAVAVNAAKSLGLRIGQDVAVTGFDGGFVQQLTEPVLTSVRIPVDRIAAELISCCLREIDEGRPPPASWFPPRSPRRQRLSRCGSSRCCPRRPRSSAPSGPAASWSGCRTSATTRRRWPGCRRSPPRGSRPAGAPAEASTVGARALRDALAIYAIDLEGLAALDPDLILTQDLCEVCAVSYGAVCAPPSAWPAARSGS